MSGSFFFAGLNPGEASRFAIFCLSVCPTIFSQRRFTEFTVINPLIISHLVEILIFSTVCKYDNAVVSHTLSNFQYKSDNAVVSHTLTNFWPKLQEFQNFVIFF